MFLDTSQVQFLDFRSNRKILLLQFQVKTIQNLPNSQYEFLRNFLIIETVQRNKSCKRQSFGKVFSGLKATATSLKSAFGQILKLK